MMIYTHWMNDEMKRKGGSGTYCKTAVFESMLNFFVLHVSTPAKKAVV
jgi:hypothetical protein